MEMTLLDCMSGIIDALKDDEGKKEKLAFSEDKLPLIKEETDYLNSQMDLNPIQSVILSALLQKSSSGKSTMEGIAAYLGMNFIKFLTYDKEMESLWNKWLIRRRGPELWIPYEVIEQLRDNRPYRKPDTKNLSTRKIFKRFDSLFKLIKNNMISFSQLMKELDEIVYNNQKTSIGKFVRDHLVSEDLYSYDIGERFLFFLLIHLYDNTNEDMISWGDLEDYFHNVSIYDDLVDLYQKGDLKLQKEGIIEYVEMDGLLEKEYFHIKDSLKAEILADKGGLHPKAPFVCDIDPKDIAVKDLVYNSTEQKQVATLEGLLSQDKLKQIYESLKSKGFRTGFTCLFYGAPGTGKTETAYQLAKKTGRKIILADVSKIKNCYVGETEKNIRSLFREYRRACDTEEQTPILLFNEADSIFGIRNESARNAVDKMENSMQNIILQEMENLTGILIATTNLTENLDKAFERRFLYKIKFSKPTLSEKERIWRSMLPSLSREEATQLASSYDFSGGQIENIVRKREIQSILLGHEPEFEDIKGYCCEENIDTSSRNGVRIGF